MRIGSSTSKSSLNTMENSSHANMAAVKLNNEAVLLIATFNYTAACDLLSEALQLLREGFTEDDDSVTNPRYSEHQEIQQTSGAGPEIHGDGHMRLGPRLRIAPRNCLRSDGGPPNAASQHQHEVDCSAASCYYIYRKPIEIQELPSSGMSADDYSLLSQALLFNLALVHHLAALNRNVMSSDTSSRDATLQKAIKLYQLSHVLICQETLGYDDAVYFMASLSNLAHIHHMVGNKIKAEQCCQHLLACIMYMTEYDDERTYSVFREFFPTIKHLILEDSHTAAGA
jgi:hypothetical protein